MTTNLLPEERPEERRKGEKEESLDTALIEEIKRKARARKIRAARQLASRMQRLPDGSRVFIRFSHAQRLEHQLLIGTFTTLAVTGLLQRYSQLSVSAFLIRLLGGIETSRTIHHIAAFLFILLAIYHTLQILNIWFVKREKGSMWPRRRDLHDLVQMVKFNLGSFPERPQFDRFSVEEKIEYWALLWGSMIMILTGLIQWFPTTTTTILPGVVIPISRAVHGLEAVLAVLSVLIWHGYHTVIKERNRSIFTGLMTEKEMQELHPLEYRRIIAAQQFLQHIAEAEEEEEKASETESQLTIPMEGMKREAI